MIRIAAAALAATVALAPLAASAATDDAPQNRMEKRAEMMSKRFDKLDKNKDGAVDMTELEATSTRAFDKADTNKDGVIDEAETKVVRDRMAERRGDRPAKPNRKDRLQRADADKDGKITREEFAATAAPWFKRADADKDGKVTKAELDDLVGKLQKRADKAGAKRSAE
jgi:Ca2+-binding EF-hand superfamily protein